MRREHSSGGVVFTRGESGPKLLMIDDAYGRWCLPKGLIEKGESTEEAALREIEEETGITGSVKCFLGKTHYFYTSKGGEAVSKTVWYYLIETKNEVIRPLTEEIRGARWVEAEEVLKVSGYPTNHAILEKALKIIPTEIVT